MKLSKQASIFTIIIAVTSFIFLVLSEVGYGYTFYQTNNNLQIEVPLEGNGITEYPSLGGIFDIAKPIFVYLTVFLIICAIATIIIGAKERDKMAMITGIICGIIVPVLCVFCDWAVMSLITGNTEDVRNILRSMVAQIYKGG